MIMVLMMMVIMMLVCFMMALMMFIVIVVLLMMLISFMMNMLFFMTNNIGGPGNINLGVCTMSMKEFNTFLHIFGVNDCLTNSLGNLCLLHHFFRMALFFFLVFTVGSRVETCRLAVVNSRSLVSVMIIFMMNNNNRVFSFYLVMRDNNLILLFTMCLKNILTLLNHCNMFHNIMFYMALLMFCLLGNFVTLTTSFLLVTFWTIYNFIMAFMACTGQTSNQQKCKRSHF